MKFGKIKYAVSLFAAVSILVASGCSLIPGESSITLSKPSSSESDIVTSLENDEPMNGDGEEAVPESEEETASEEKFDLTGGRKLYVTGVSDPIAIRATDGDGGEVLAQVELGTEVNLISADSTTCYYVFCEEKNVSGYIKKYYLTDEESAVSKNSTYYASKKTPLYDTKDDEKIEIQKVDLNTAVVVLAKTSGDYWYVNLKDTNTFGYIKCTELSSSKTEVSSAATSSKASSTSSANSNTNTNNNNNNYNYNYYSSEYSVWTVQNTKHYLAVRTAPEYNSNNEIGKIYNGDTVRVYSYSYVNFSDRYWYVYSPTLGLWGYVDSNYIYS